MKQLTLFILLALISGCYARVPDKTGEEGKPIPNFRIQKDSISGFYTSKIPKGNPIVMVYYGTNCPYSRSEIQEILEGADDLKYVGFYLITAEDFPAILKFRDAYAIWGYRNVFPGKDVAGFFSKHFNVPGVPYTVIYNREGKLTAAFAGKIGLAEIKKYIDA